MNAQHRNLMPFVLVVSLIVSGCGQALGPAATPSPANTAVPTSTNTPSPTFTPTPTIDPPAQLTGVFEDVRLTYFESFDSVPARQWDLQPCQTVNNGKLQYSCSDGLLSSPSSFYQGQGALIDFRHPKQAGDYWWGIGFVSGDFGQDDWRRFGIAEGSDGPYVVIDKAGAAPIGFPKVRIKSDTWYRVALATAESGRVAILLWERDNPDSQPWKLADTLGNDWSKLKWRLWVNDAHGVVMDLDNYYEFSFPRVK